MAKEGDNSFGIASVTLGIAAVALSFLIFPSAILGVVSLIFGIMQRKYSKNKWALWGIILGIVSIILTILAVYYYGILANQLGSQLSQLPGAGLPGQ